MYNKKIITSLIILLVITTRSILAFGQYQHHYYKGTIGSYPIILTLSIDTADYRLDGSSYFYEDNGRNIKLNGTRLGKSLELRTNNINAENELFKLEISNTNTITGTYITKDNNNAVVVLVGLSPKQITLNTDLEALANTYPWILYNYTNNHLDVLKLNKMSFKKDSVQRVNNSSVVWYTEKISGIPFFRLNSSSPSEQSNQINDQLSAIHYSLAIIPLQCPTHDAHQSTEINTAVTYLNQNLLGYKIIQKTNCKREDMTTGLMVQLLDLNNGMQYALKDLYRFDNSLEPLDPNIDIMAYLKYRDNVEIPTILNLLKKRFPADFENKNEEKCNYYDKNNWNLLNWSMTEKGIDFIPWMENGESECQNPFLIPFEDLEPYKNPKFPYRFPSK